MDEDTKKELKEQGRKIEEIHQTVLYLKRYFAISLFIKILIILLPILGIIWSMPRLMEFYEEITGGIM